MKTAKTSVHSITAPATRLTTLGAALIALFIAVPLGSALSALIHHMK